MVSKKTSSSKAPDNAAFDFEASLTQLEDLVTRMEDGEMSLDESLKAFEEGVKLTRLCQETLVAAQQKVQLLMEQQGKVTLHDMPDVDVDSGDDDEE